MNHTDRNQNANLPSATTKIFVQPRLGPKLDIHLTYFLWRLVLSVSVKRLAVKIASSRNDRNYVQWGTVKLNSLTQ